MFTPPAPAEDDESLLFMTHAPGAIVAPREEPKLDESFAGRILGKLGVDLNATPKSAKERRGFAAQIADGAGREALGRAVAASRRASGRLGKAAPKPLEGAAVHVRAVPKDAPRVVVATPTARAREGNEPGTGGLSLLLGALVTPLRALPIVLFHAVLLGAAILLLELAAPLGLAACAVACVAALSLRVRHVRDAGDGKRPVAFPDLTEAFGAVISYSAAALWLLPALVALLLTVGPPVLEAGVPGSLPSRARALLSPVAAEEATGTTGAAAPRGQGLGYTAYRILDVAIGPASSLTAEGANRSADELARDVASTARARLAALVSVEGASAPGGTARVLLVLGASLFPMALLCAVRLRSAYAALYLPIVLRSILRVPGAYLLGLLLFAAQTAALAVAVFGLAPLLRQELGSTPGHLAWVGLVASLAVALPLGSGAYLGRLYAARRARLDWED